MPRVWLVTALIVGIAISTESLAQTNASSGISMPTELRVRAPGWWPTKGDPSRDEYVGTAVCAKCHAAKAAAHRATAMAHAASRATDSESLLQHDHLDYELGPYSYQIATSSEKSVLKVRDKAASVSESLLWAIGVGHMGQTYIYERDGNFYESHLSFFSAPQALDITPGLPRDAPQNLADAAGRRMSAAEARRCFGCHTTASTAKNQFEAGAATPGVTCEGCHGPGAGHVGAFKSGMEDQAAKFILNPGHLNPVDSVDFCGACHRTWEDVVGGGLTGIGVFNVRFAPYRLENSRCWKKGDARITCIGCHDPHQALVRDAASYDSRCLQCHIDRVGAKRTADHPGAGCPVSEKNCVTCHMPKIEPPNLHSAFADHWIRIVRPGKPYPD